jgi:uncharacterized protein
LIGHLETIAAALRPAPRVSLARERWETPDGDFIDVDFAGDEALPRLLVLLHGLEGCSDSHYARLVARAFPEAGWRVAIAHWRGCSGEPNRRPRAYHSGDSVEVEWILRRFARPIDVIGVSLGGNALLKWLGERGDAAKRLVRRAAAISAPLDLRAAACALDRGLNRLLYTRMFLATLKPKSLAKLAGAPALFDEKRLRAARTFREFDDVFTAPLHGFRDVNHYWNSASSGPWLSHIQVPTLVINARNDPFLPERSLMAATRNAAPAVTLEFPERGGHVGFPPHWLVRRLQEFFRW